MKQQTRVVGYDGERDHPWPIIQVICPECGQWTNGSDVAEVINNCEYPLCQKCADELELE